MEVTGSNPVEAVIFLQASSPDCFSWNLLQWSLFTFINNRSTNVNYFIYTSHHFTPHRKLWTQLIDLPPNVWLHSSVGRAWHRHSWRSRVWILLKPWFFSDSSFQLLKLENLLQSSFFTFIYNLSTNINYFICTLHIISLLMGIYELNWLTSLPVWGFIAQLVEHGTGILLSNCLSWKSYCNDHSSLSSTTAVQVWIISLYTLHRKKSSSTMQIPRLCGRTHARPVYRRPNGRCDWS